MHELTDLFLQIVLKGFDGLTRHPAGAIRTAPEPVEGLSLDTHSIEAMHSIIL
ncbi:hypothetical protein [Ravibacter arvi]